MGLQALRSSDHGSIMVLFYESASFSNKIKFVNVLVDLWKLGVKDCFGQRRMTEKEWKRMLNKYAERGAKLELCSVEEAKWLVQHGLRIADEIGTPRPKEFEQFRDIIGDFSSVVVEGSLYKCFSCNKKDLQDYQVERIKKVAQRELKNGVAGTPAEEIIWFSCANCGSKDSDKTFELFQ